MSNDVFLPTVHLCYMYTVGFKQSKTTMYRQQIRTNLQHIHNMNMYCFCHEFIVNTRNANLKMVLKREIFYTWNAWDLWGFEWDILTPGTIFAENSSCTRWWIQDFPKQGAPTPYEEMPMPNAVTFRKKNYVRIRGFRSEGRARARPCLDLPIVKKSHENALKCIHVQRWNTSMFHPVFTEFSQ